MTNKTRIINKSINNIFYIIRIITFNNKRLYFLLLKEDLFSINILLFFLKEVKRLNSNFGNCFLGDNNEANNIVF